MNIDKKLELAHEYAGKLAMNHAVTGTNNDKDIALRAWEYADTMGAEYKKREEEQKFDVLKNDCVKKAEDDAIIYGVGFIRVLNKDGVLSTERIDPKLVSVNLNCGFDNKDWQPDWSVAPESANYWAMDEDTRCNWYGREPEVIGNRWDYGNVLKSSSSFNYQGGWKYSLRKRPK